MSINRNLKRLIREYEFLLEDMDDVLEMHKSANQELNRAIRLAKEDDVADSDFEKDEEGEEEVETFEDTPERKVLKKLFRKIVFKCHPDRLPNDMNKLEREEMQDIYEKAVLAHDRDNWGLMVVVAIKLDIKLPKEAEGMIDRIAEETKGLKNQINQLTGSFAWQWYHAEDELQKRMIDDYLNTLKKIKEKNALKEKKKILVVGHPRTGTGYTAKLLQSWGLDVQHEKLGKDGTASWPLAATEEKTPIFLDFNFKQYDWEIIIYCVRDPKDSISSIAYTEDINDLSLSYRERWSGFKRTKNRLTTAIISLTSWDDMIIKLEPDFIFQVEDGQQDLFNFLKAKKFKVKKSKDKVDTNYNSRKHPKIDSLVKKCGYDLFRYQDKINKYCERYGYPHIF